MPTRGGIGLQARSPSLLQVETGHGEDPPDPWRRRDPPNASRLSLNGRDNTVKVQVSSSQGMAWCILAKEGRGVRGWKMEDGRSYLREAQRCNVSNTSRGHLGLLLLKPPVHGVRSLDLVEEEGRLEAAQLPRVPRIMQRPD